MADVTAPTLLQMSPSDNATGVSVTSNLRLGFSEAVNATSGLIKIYKSDGTLFHTIAANDTSQVFFDSTKARVTIDPSVSLLAGTSYYVIVDTGAFEDLAGNDYAGISSPTALNFTTAGSAPPPSADTTAPLLTGTTPSDNATGVNVSSNLILTFNEAVKAGVGNIEIRNSANGQLVQSIAVTDAAKVSFSGNQVTINPGSDLSPEMGYYVTFASGVVRDLANNAFAGIASAAVFNFTTESDYVDTTAPIIIFSSPDDYLTGNKNLIIVFNEPVRAGSGVIEIRNAADDSLYTTISVTDTSQVSFSGRDVTINPTNDLPSGNYYVVIAPTAFEDLYGHDFDASFGIGVNAVAVGTFTNGSAASVFNAGTIAIASNLSAFASAFASATATGIGGGAPPEDLIAGNDASLDVSTFSLAAAVNGNVAFASSDQVDVLGTDGLTYRFFGSSFVFDGSHLTSGTDISLIEVWAGFGTSAHILYSHYVDSTGVFWLQQFSIASRLSGPNTIIGSSDEDKLFGFEGNDVIVGREGDDVLNGGGGADVLHGGPGADTLTGGAWEDTFSFSSVAQFDGDMIADLAVGDVIDFTPLPGPIYFIGEAAFSGVAGQLRYATGPDFTTVEFDLDGNGFADGTLFIDGGNWGIAETAPGTKQFKRDGPGDVQMPLLTGTTPATSATGVAINANIVLTFSEAVEAGSGNIQIKRSLDHTVYTTISITDTTQVTFAGNQLIINPNVNLESNTNYYVTVALDAVRDLAGNAYWGISLSQGFTFKTADVIAPQLVSTNPHDGEVGQHVETSPMLFFNESVMRGTGNIEIRHSSDGSLFESIPVGDLTGVSIGGGGEVIIINPASNFAPGTEYYVVFGGGVITDLSGNPFAGISAPTAFNFTTAGTGGGSPPGGLILTGTIASNTLVGGAGDDVITGLGRNDTLTGAGGADTFVYTAVSDSMGRGYDTLTDFNASADVIDLWFQVTGVDTAITSGSLSPLTFDSNLASTVGAAKLAGHHAVLFTPNAGMLSGKTFLIVDANGVAGYQANADLVILLGNASSLAGLTAADFV